MPEPFAFYSRPSLNVETYDARHPRSMTGTPVAGDVDFYRALAADADGGPILELACGTGRVAFALAEAGADVTGLDRSAPMLEVARRRRADAPPETQDRLRFVEGDMAAVRLPDRYGLAIIAFRSFQALLTVEDQRRCLASVREVLRPRGQLVLDLFDPMLDRCVPDLPHFEPIDRSEVEHPDHGTRVVVTIEGRRNDPVRQILSETWRFRELRADGSVAREETEELRLRWTYRHELHHLLELEGFAVEAEYADFDRSPPRYAGEIIAVARRP